METKGSLQQDIEEMTGLEEAEKKTSLSISDISLENLLMMRPWGGGYRNDQLDAISGFSEWYSLGVSLSH